MHLPKHKLITVYLSIFIILASLCLFSLPVLAGPMPDKLSGSSPNVSSMATLSNILPGIVQMSLPAPLVTITQSIVMTDTNTPTPSDFPTPTETPTPTLFPTATSTPLPTQFSYLPYLYQEHFNPTNTPTPAPEPILFCDDIGAPLFIPDNNDAGVNADISIPDGRLLVNARLYLDISHTFVGDLVVTLTNLSSNQTVTVIDRPGAPPWGCANSDIVTILDDGAIQYADDQCASPPHAISGIYLPVQKLSTFTGLSAYGTWRLNVSDHYINDTGFLNHWCLETKLSSTMPAPTPLPTPVSLPASAYIAGMTGQNQALKLDCESRSAVDWAKHFGFNIDELDFVSHLPYSDDPETGFVGNPNANWGNIPPYDYGIHALPVANLLREYGLTASSFKSLSWDDLRAEIAAGNPVIVWIIGNNFKNIVNGTPHYYIVGSTGDLRVVAPNEHTAILVGYSPTYVTVLNGANFLDVSIDQFLDSWSVLDFMAVVAR
jgi:subtilisin-like proprotein convertase family protein/uncharacterized protein YvpB